MKLRFSFRWQLLFIFSLVLALFLGKVSQTNAQVSESNQLVKQGVELYQQGNYVEAIAKWNSALTDYQGSSQIDKETTVLENLARGYQKLGKPRSAIEHWDKAIALYRQWGNKQKIGRSLTEQAQLYSSLGQQRKALSLLCGNQTEITECSSESAISLTRQQRDKLGEAAALGSLGEVYRLRGNYELAIANLEATLKIAEKIERQDYLMSALNGLGNIYKNLGQVQNRRANSARLIGKKDEEESFERQSQQNYLQASNYYQKSLRVARQQNNIAGEMRSLLNSIPVYYRLAESTAAEQTKVRALKILNTLPASREKAYAGIKLAKLSPSGNLSPTECLTPQQQTSAISLLQDSLSIARKIEDSRAESFALGELGHIYECRFVAQKNSQDYERAINHTKQARMTAERNLQAKDSLYLWEWQSGRILRAGEQMTSAISTYQRAIATLEEIRDDIIIANRDLQYDFRDAVEPLYRNLMSLQLKDIPTATLLARQSQATKNVDSFLTTFDSLKLAELQNYFGDDCALRVVETARIDSLKENQNTAVFSSIIFDNRTGIVVSFPDGSKKINWLDRNRETLRAEIDRFRIGLERYFDENYNPTDAQNIYQWLIAPFDKDLERAGIKTLVFVQDGILRSVPMAALHDGSQFLVQKYAIATTPSLTLTDPQTIDRDRLTALALGLTEKTQLEDGTPFPALPNVEREIQIINTKLEGSTPILNRQFTKTRLKEELDRNNYPVVHIATHGQFSSEPEQTFLVMGDRQKLTITDLDRLIRSTAEGAENIDLLSLTACQTAVGDDRAALGLAGVALQAGVKSALASLWFINDNKTPEIMDRFYTSLQNPEVSKAEALQKAQITSIEQGDHPAIWSPFILIGNWL